MSFYRWNPYAAKDGTPHRVSVSPAPSTPQSTPSSGRSLTSPAAPSQPDAHRVAGENSEPHTDSSPPSSRSSLCHVEAALGLAPEAATRLASSGDLEADPGAGQGLSLVCRLRTLPTDTAIEDAVRAFELGQQQQLVAVLAATPRLVSELCLTYRGNVLCHTLALLPESDPALIRILRPLIPQFPEMLQHQHGTIALIRLFDHCDLTFRIALCAETVDRISDLAIHPYGNFVVSRVLEALNGEMSGDAAALLARVEAYFADASNLRALGTNKFGSHVLETWCRSCTGEAILRTAGALFTSPPLVVALGFHPVGNFPLQAVLRRLATSFPAGHRYAAEVSAVPTLVAESRFHLNIRKALHGEHPRKKESTPRHAPSVSPPPFPGSHAN